MAVNSQGARTRLLYSFDLVSPTCTRAVRYMHVAEYFSRAKVSRFRAACGLSIMRGGVDFPQHNFQVH